MKSLINDNEVEREALALLEILSGEEHLRLLISERTSGANGEWYNWSRAFIFDERNNSSVVVPLRAALLCMVRLWVVPRGGCRYGSYWELSPSGRTAVKELAKLAA